MIFGLFNKKPYKKRKILFADSWNNNSSILKDGGTTKTIFIPKFPPELLGDESGDLGKGKGSSEYFTTTVVLTDNPDYFKYVGGKYKANTKPDKHGNVGDPNGELKFTTSSDEVRIAVLKDLMKSEPKIYSIIRDKRKTKYSGIELYKKNYEDVLELIAKEESGDIKVEIDDHSALKRINFKKICKDKSDDDTKLLTEIKKKGVNSKFDKRFQAVDFPVGAIGHFYKKKLPKEDRKRYYDIIKARTTKIEKNDNLKMKRVGVRGPDMTSSVPRLIPHNTKSNGKYKKLFVKKVVR